MAGRAIAEYLYRLGVNGRLCLRMSAEQVPGPGQRAGRRLVPGQQDRDQLVSQHTPPLARIPLAGVGVGQDREQVGPVPSAGMRTAPHQDLHRVLELGPGSRTRWRSWWG